MHQKGMGEKIICLTMISALKYIIQSIFIILSFIIICKSHSRDTDGEISNHSNSQEAVELLVPFFSLQSKKKIIVPFTNIKTLVNFFFPPKKSA